jgi:hypothetical protein
MANSFFPVADSLGKGEVVSSILTGSTRFSLGFLRVSGRRIRTKAHRSERPDTNENGTSLHPCYTRATPGPIPVALPFPARLAYAGALRCPRQPTRRWCSGRTRRRVILAALALAGVILAAV